MSSNKKRTPPKTYRPEVETRASHSSASKKTFSLKAFVDELWAARDGRRLVTVPDLVSEYCLKIGDDPAHPSKLWSRRMGRELRRVGAQPVPRENCRKTFGEEHRTMPQLWLLSDDPCIEYLASVHRAWEEFTLQKKDERIVRSMVRDYERRRVEALRAARESVQEAVPDRQ